MTLALRFGLSDEHLREIKSAFTKCLKADQTLSVWIFGSRARGDHRPGSDIDLLFEAQPALSPKQLADLESALDESEVPYKFDLVQRPDTAPTHRQNIESEKILLWELGGP